MIAAPSSDGGGAPALLRNFMSEYGERLVENGYPILPIIPGPKSPGVWSARHGCWQGYREWTKHCRRETKSYELSTWVKWPGCGIGVACGIIHGVDIDLLDEPAALAIERLARKMLGDTPCIRIGLAPKRLLVYRSAVSFPSIKGHPIEVLGDGSQFVAYGIHQDTGHPYFWSHEGLDEAHFGRLPEITEQQAREFADAAYKLVPPELRQARLRPPRHREYYYAPNGEQRGTVPAIAAALEHIPNDDLDYDSWKDIGLAVKAAVGDGGLQAFAAWSAKSTKDRPSYTAKFFRGIKRETLHSIGAGTVYEQALSEGWLPEHHLILNGAVEEAMEATGGGASGIGDALRATQARREADVDRAPEPEKKPNGEASEAEQRTRHASPSPDVSSVEPEYDVVANAGGLLGDLTQWMVTTARFPQPLLSLGAALTLCGALMGHRYRLLDGPDTRTNHMVLGLAGSGSGKEHPRQCVTKALRAAGLEKFYLGRGIASMQGLIGALASFHSGVLQLDEAGMFFGSTMDPRAPPYLRQIVALLMELSTSATTVFADNVRAADREQNTIKFDIPDPCLNVFATTVPETFWASLNSGAATAGFLARFLMLQTPKNYPDPQTDTPPVEEGLPKLIGRMRQLVAGPGVQATDLAILSALNALQPRWEGEGAARRRLINMPEPYTVPMTQEARAEDRRIAMIEAELKREHEGKTHATAIIARTTEQTRKYALTRAGSKSPFLTEVDYSDMRWGFEMAVKSQHLMLPAIERHIADSRHGADVNKVLDVLRRNGGLLDGHTFCAKTQFLKRRDRDDIVAQLSEFGADHENQGPALDDQTALALPAPG